MVITSLAVLTSARRIGAALTLAALGIVLPASACGFAQVQARIATPSAGYYRVAEPVPVTVNQKFDEASLALSVQPKAAYSVEFTKSGFQLRPILGWTPNTTYKVRIKKMASADHLSYVSNVDLHFRTQPHTGIAGFLVDGKAVTGQPTVRPSSHLGIAFTEPMKEASVKVLFQGQPLDPSKLQWAQDGKSVTLNNGLTPYRQVVLTMADGAVTAKGDPTTDTPTLNATVVGLAPSNNSSGIDKNFKVVAPILVVIDNAQVARPQAGLQDADVVYEYISEYSISRFTLIYFNQPAGQMGPVRSCRMINPYLITQYDGIQMCSGASVGTLHFMFGDPGGGLPYMKSSINDFDQGGHFFRVGFKAAPHNLYTDHDKAVRLRSELGVSPPTYLVDPTHPDTDIGTPSDAPQIPLHGVGYTYDGNARVYNPVDNGSPRIDTNHGGAQLQVKNVVLMHVNCHDAGWVEDENGGAHSVWYDMNGSGGADVYMDGKVVHGQWHTGTGDQAYFQNTQMPFFTDESGNFLRLDSGLTWIHVLGSCN